MPTSALIGLVVLLSLGLSGYELFKIFGRDFGRALGNRFALLVGVLNVITATLVWWIIHGLLAVEPSILSALVTGLTFPALLRSRFTLYRSIGPTETGEVDELSLKMDQIYQDLQRALYNEVNLHLTTARLELAYAVRQAFNARQLADYLEDFISLERLPAEQRQHQEQLEKIMSIADAQKRHIQLANFLLDLKNEAEIQAMIRRGSLAGADNRENR
jgi:hypothetical protein